MIIDAHTHLSQHWDEKEISGREALSKLQAEMKQSKTDHALVLAMFKKPNQCAEHSPVTKGNNARKP